MALSDYKQVFNPRAKNWNLIPQSLAVAWSAIIGKPTSSPADIDDAVSNSHAPHSDDQVIPTQLSDLSDDATHRLVTDDEKSIWNQISDVALNVMLNAFRVAHIGSLTIFSMVKGFMDEYEDESGVDLVNSSGQVYDSSNDYYKNYSDIDAETVLLLHLDNDVTDSEITPKTVTNNNVTFDGTTKKLGSYSAVFNGTTSYLSIPDSDDWDFGTGDFTIEGYINFDTISVYADIFNHRTDPSDYWSLTQKPDNGLNFAHRKSETYEIALSTPSSVITTGQWYHVALVRTSGVFKIFIDGVSQTLTGTDSSASSITGFTQPLTIGGGPDNGFTHSHIDELRISKGIARWTSNFTPPSVQYPISGNMTLLSLPQTAASIPTAIRINIFEEDVDSIVLNIDLKAYISRDNGVTFTEAVLEDEGNYIATARILSAVVDVNSQPSGTQVVYKIETLNNKKLKIHATGIAWR